MGPLVLPLIAAGAELAGGALSSMGQASANKANLRIAREQMQFQERMSNTQYQRAMSDMKAAGLNPLLAYQQGGAGAPVGQTATMENVTAPFASSVRGAGELAQSSARTLQELAVLKETKRRTAAEADKSEWDAAEARRNYIIGNSSPEGGADTKYFPRDTINWDGLAARAFRANIENVLAGASSARASSEATRALVGEREARSSLGDLLRRFTDTANRGYDSLANLWRRATERQRKYGHSRVIPN